MGLILWFWRCPTPRIDAADDGLAATVNVNVLDSYLLLALAAVPVQSFEQRRVCPRELVRLGQIFASALEGLLAAAGKD